MDTIPETSAFDTYINQAVPSTPPAQIASGGAMASDLSALDWGAAALARDNPASFNSPAAPSTAPEDPLAEFADVFTDAPIPKQAPAQNPTPAHTLQQPADAQTPTQQPTTPQQSQPKPQSSVYDVGDAEIMDGFEPFKDFTRETLAKTYADLLKEGTVPVVDTQFSPEDTQKMTAGDFSPVGRKFQEVQYRTMVATSELVLQTVAQQLGASLPGLFKNFGAGVNKLEVGREVAAVAPSPQLQAVAKDFSTRYVAKYPNASPQQVAEQTGKYMAALKASFVQGANAAATQQAPAEPDWSAFN